MPFWLGASSSPFGLFSERQHLGRETITHPAKDPHRSGIGCKTLPLTVCFCVEASIALRVEFFIVETAPSVHCLP